MAAASGLSEDFAEVGKPVSGMNALDTFCACLLSPPPLLVLALLWLPQVHSCAELIQLLLSVASASVLTPSAFLLAGGAGDGDGDGASS